MKIHLKLSYFEQKLYMLRLQSIGIGQKFILSVVPSNPFLQIIYADSQKDPECKY